MPDKVCLTSELLKGFVGGQFRFTLRSAVLGFAAKCYCGEVEWLAYENSNLRVKFRWLAESMNPDAPEEGSWAGEPRPPATFTFELSLWDVARSKEEPGCLEFYDGRTRSSGMLRPPATGDRPQPKLIAAPMGCASS